MKMYVDGAWRGAGAEDTIIAPYTGEPIEVVPAAGPKEVEMALAAAHRGAAAMRSLTAAERAAILNRAADLLDARLDDIAATISAEVGKPISEARTEATRSAELLRLSAFEGSQLRGETLPLDAQPGAVGKMGFTVRVPAGVVVTISPFNYPLLLVVHKVGPALATGNAVILKPANQTPLAALKLTEALLEAGLPELGIQCLTGRGSEVGPALCADGRVRKISFTGSTAVGEAIARVAGVKRLSLELGSNSPMIVLPDADLERAAEIAAVAGTVNAGQVCLSLQRIYVHQQIYDGFLGALEEAVAPISVADPSLDDTRLGPMISAGEAERVAAWIGEAREGGARVVAGGEHDGARFQPTVVADMTPGMRIAVDELFGPAMGVAPVETIDEAIAMANDTDYGLSASIFTRNINHAMRFVGEVESGNVHINWSPLWRADFMPYGGLKGSGIGKEGPRYAAEEMTELKTVVFHDVDRD